MSKIERGQVWVVEKPGYWVGFKEGDWCKVLVYSPPNVHVRWNPKSLNRGLTCMREDTFRAFLKINEASTVSTILIKYNE